MTTIYDRINRVRAACHMVAKDSRVRTGGEGEYRAVSHDAVTSAVREAMIEHGVLCIPSLVESRVVEAGATKRGTPIIRYEGTYDVNFIAVDGQDAVKMRVEAHANDMGDKAPGKALSYATKSAMLKVFTLETGQDDEARVDASSSPGSVDRLITHNNALRDALGSVAAVKSALTDGDIDRATEAWAELTRAEERALWVAPSKGGILTTEEREAVKSTEFTTALKARRDDAGWYDNPENQDGVSRQ